MTHLKRKLAQFAVGGLKSAKVDELEFLLKVVELSGGKTDLKALASELGLKVSAASMRLTRLTAEEVCAEYGDTRGRLGEWGGRGPDGRG